MTRRCKCCSSPLPEGSAAQRRYCENQDCGRERARRRKEQERGRLVRLEPRENFWDPVAKREIPRKHRRTTSEWDEAGAEGRYERIQLAIKRRRATIGLVETIGCRGCADAYLSHGPGAKCEEHRDYPWPWERTR
jgi:hypothetical protein